MATVYQASAGATNANKITISMWCRAHTTNLPSDNGDTFSLIEFGNPEGVNSDIANYIQLNNNTNTPGNSIFCQFAGIKDSIDGLDVCTSNLASGSSGTQYWPDYDPTVGRGNPWPFLTNSGAGGVTLTPLCSMSANSVGAAVNPGKWFHLMVAIDASHTSSYADPFNGNKFYMVLNGVALSVRSSVSDVTRTNGNFIPAMNDSVRNDFGFGPFKWIGGSSSEYLTVGNIPPIDFDLSGTEIGIPSQRASIYKNTQLLDMADVQIWVGQYIDPTDPANFEKFVSISGGRGFPASPYGAAIAFGPQTYLFTGNSSTFYDNQGTGGVFSKSGTLSNISGPSY